MLRIEQLIQKIAEDEHRSDVAIEAARKARSRAQQAVWHARRLRAELLTANAIYAAGRRSPEPLKPNRDDRYTARREQLYTKRTI